MENARNPTDIREMLIEDIHGKLTSAAEDARKGRPRPAILKKDAADVLWTWGAGHGFLTEEDREMLYGNRFKVGGKGEYKEGIFPEDAEARCRKIIDFDDVEKEVVKRVSNVLNRALAVITSRADRMAVKRIFDEIPRV